MDSFANNQSVGSRLAGAGARRPSASVDPSATGDLSAVSGRLDAAGTGSLRASGSGRSSRASAKDAKKPGLFGRSGKAAKAAGRKSVKGADVADVNSAARAASARKRRSSAGTNFMRYANDRPAVQAIYNFTTGSMRPVFITLVVAAIAIGVYFPVRDLYVAQRTNYVLTRQLELAQAYDDYQSKITNGLLSEEGVKDAAREMGLVDEGEKKIDVVGLDELLAAENGESTSADDSSGDAATADGDSGSADATDSGDSSADDFDSSDSSADGPDASDDTAADDEDTSESVTAETVDTSKTPTSSAELKAAQEAVAKEAPWYVQMFDVFFGFNGVEGQQYSSSGK